MAIAAIVPLMLVTRVPPATHIVIISLLVASVVPAIVVGASIIPSAAPATPTASVARFSIACVHCDSKLRKSREWDQWKEAGSFDGNNNYGT